MKAYIMIAACSAVAGCTPVERVGEDETPRIGMPNPASEYCVKSGGKLEMRNGESGVTGYCHLPDGQVVEEWELFRKSHTEKQGD